nr:hypothetical protein [uncultured Rhodopila sp.]
MSDLLDRMRRDPAGDWTIRDVEIVCRRYGILCEPARGAGSHYKVAHKLLAEKLTVPCKRPIKSVYIRELVAFVDAVRDL